VSNPKPFIQAASVCEKVLIEPDNVASPIRLVDTFTLNAPAEALSADLPVAPLTLYISLKSGDVVGEYEVGLQLNRPDGKTSPRRNFSEPRKHDRYLRL
jgi:hypothetical protein